MFKNFFISYFLWPFYILHSPPASHFEAFQLQIIIMLHYIYLVMIFLIKLLSNCSYKDKKTLF